MKVFDSVNKTEAVSYTHLFMSKGPLVTFHMNDYIDDIKEVMTKKKFRDFPILDRHGRFKGFISRRRFIDVYKRQNSMRI